MTTCQACGGQINGSDRFCRSCGAPIATLVGDLVDTHPFNSTDTGSARDPHESAEARDQFYVPAAGVERSRPGSSPLYQTGLLLKQLVGQPRNWIVIMPVLVLLFALLVGAGITIGRNAHRGGQSQGAGNGDRGRRPVPLDAADADDQEANDQEQDNSGAVEAVQNGLGVVPGEVSDDEYPDIEGVFVSSLTSDASPAALGHIQAGDVLTGIGDSPVSESSDIAEALGSLQPGAEVAIKLYRDGETITTLVKIADPSHEPFGQKAEPVDQGFLGLGDVERRCCIPGTKKWGLEIDRIIDNSPADLAGLQKGDVITEFDKHTIRTADELTRRIKTATPRSKVVIKFYRGATEQTAEVLMGHGSADEDESNKE